MLDKRLEQITENLIIDNLVNYKISYQYYYINAEIVLKKNSLPYINHKIC
jgi:hypothetical protein